MKTGYDREGYGKIHAGNIIELPHPELISLDKRVTLV